jgi:hypothetical protein
MKKLFYKLLDWYTWKRGRKIPPFRNFDMPVTMNKPRFSIDEIVQSQSMTANDLFTLGIE